MTLLHTYIEKDEIATASLSTPLPYPLNMVSTTQIPNLPNRKQDRFTAKQPRLDRDSGVIYQQEALRDSKRILDIQQRKNHQRLFRENLRKQKMNRYVENSIRDLKAGKKIRL